MTVAQQGIPPQIANLLQERFLERVFHDALFLRQIFRADAEPEVWASNIGDRQIFTRAGLLPIVTQALVPGQDPQPVQYSTEQWEAEASQFGGTIDTAMPTSNVTLASLFLRNTQQLGLQAAQSLNVRARDTLFRAYGEGEAMVDIAGVSGGLTLHVTTINGFTQKLLNGRLSAVTAANPMPITFSSAEPANTVVGFTPDDPAYPAAAGTLYLGTALSATVAVRVGVFASTRARRLRVGGASTVDGITGTNIVTLADIQAAVARLRSMGVPPHADGRYHVHENSSVESQLFRDNAWQRQFQSLPESSEWKNMAIGEAMGCYFFRNEECPSALNTQSLGPTQLDGSTALLQKTTGLEVINNSGVNINRTLVTGGAVLKEKYLDESKYITEAGVTGKIGEFSITNGGVQVMTNRIRLIVRAPLDRLQQVVSQSWSWSGDFPVPSDSLTGDAARYKRAVMIESA